MTLRSSQWLNNANNDVKNFWTRLFIKKFALTIKFNVKTLSELHHQFQSNKLRTLLRGKVNARRI
ncbi:MAG: hypothetical protein CMN98_04750 [Synechococcus sp. NP17]|nr:hypothetical protein [Synechococcus sp. NP17]